MRRTSRIFSNIAICLSSLLFLFESSDSESSVRTWSCQNGQCTVKPNQRCSATNSIFCSQRKWQCRNGTCQEIDSGCFIDDIDLFHSVEDFCRGIAAGSMAASFMSWVYKFGVGMSLLSSMQSAGAVGSVGLGHIIASGAVGGAVASVVGLNLF
ncbi:hypothetical protein Bpfe_005792 [Biomphalaria pfeifferi]|uniref:Uncharacterized protein n=1 Tax=Biomphalaria pfeifferi TaxID=112525 RepID=A0AAD8C2S9_BIOPF|nr:hypothetical protein Bpfe_005792 [Biomphalaria pfeifferi]